MSLVQRKYMVVKLHKCRHFYQYLRTSQEKSESRRLFCSPDPPVCLAESGVQAGSSQAGPAVCSELAMARGQETPVGFLGRFIAISQHRSQFPGCEFAAGLHVAPCGPATCAAPRATCKTCPTHEPGGAHTAQADAPVTTSLCLHGGSSVIC